MMIKWPPTQEILGTVLHINDSVIESKTFLPSFKMFMFKVNVFKLLEKIVLVINVFIDF